MSAQNQWLLLYSKQFTCSSYQFEHLGLQIFMYSSHFPGYVPAKINLLHNKAQQNKISV